MAQGLQLIPWLVEWTAVAAAAELHCVGITSIIIIIINKRDLM